LNRDGRVGRKFRGHHQPPPVINERRVHDGSFPQFLILSRETSFDPPTAPSAVQIFWLVARWSIFLHKGAKIF
jgi:hypothetical protein